jgi:hypothetical protein
MNLTAPRVVVPAKAVGEVRRETFLRRSAVRAPPTHATNVAASEDAEHVATASGVLARAGWAATEIASTTAAVAVYNRVIILSPWVCTRHARFEAR